MDPSATDEAATSLWQPLPGPQTAAFETAADELLYGGAAGAGKTDLLIGAAATGHRKAIIFRREYEQLKDIVGRSREILGQVGTFNGQANLWRLRDGRTLEFGAVQHEDDKEKWKGRAHDLKAFDQLEDFSLAQYLFLTAWLRTTVPGQRVRIIATCNPPTSAEGEWIIKRWAPWLDATHPDPAEPGELRWFAVVDGEDTECGSGEPFDWKGERITPQSRTFIPGRLSDNPYLDADGRYRSRLQAMPEPLRTQLLFGDFTVGLKDDPWQVIPTAWIRAAQERWRPDGRPKTPDGKPRPLTVVAADIAQGGDDRTVLVRRYHTWIAEPEIHDGTTTPDAQVNAGLVLAAVEDGLATIDADGIGASTYFLVRAKIGERAAAFNGGAPALFRDRTGTLDFANLRAAAYWRLREWLDPVNGAELALPPGREVLAELTAVRWKMQRMAVQLEKKEEVKKRLGRSPDLADALAMSLMVMPPPGPMRVTWGRG